jgi:hypothetical protein
MLIIISLTKSIGSLMVSQTLEHSEPQRVQKYMTLSTLKNHTHKCHGNMSTHVFPDLPLLHITQKTSCYTLETQHANVPSDPQTESILSAPPFWKLQADVLVGRQATVGYSAFVAQYEQSEIIQVASDTSDGV